MSQAKKITGLLAVLTIFTFFSAGCSKPQAPTSGDNISNPGTFKMASADIQEAAMKSYVPPGKLDEYYLFASGGHSGQLFVYGVPSMRRVRTIPVFAPDCATGWGFDNHSKALMRGYTVGDLHHPAVTETNGEYDGRFIVVNDNLNNRAAMINLKSFQTVDMTAPIPNIAGPHSAAFITPNSEYFIMGSRFGAPVPQGNYATLDEFGSKYYGVLAGVAVDTEKEKLNLAWEVLLPPWSYDLSDAGKKVSDGYAFLTTYNTEEATHTIEVGASQRDRDYIVVLNWKEVEKVVKEGKFEEIDGAKVVDPVKTKGLVYLIPVAKSPHGVDVTPDGKYILASGKLSPTVTVYDFDKIQQAIAKQDLKGEEKGLPILNYESVRVAEVEVGLGPLHNQFDDKGYAYTTLFIDSGIAKWKIGDWNIVDKVQVAYNPGHACAAEGDTVSPDGKYLVSLNKMAKDQYIGVGPSHPESLQLIDLTGEKMKVINQAPVDLEPHYAQMVKVDKIKPMEVIPKDEKTPNSIWDPKQAKIERNGNKVEVWMMAVRSRFYPDEIKVNEGDHVTIHITNVEQDEDISHGLGIPLYNFNMEVQPGETKTVDFVADKAGVFPFYCTNFCSAMHQEMQGFFLVKPNKS